MKLEAFPGVGRNATAVAQDASGLVKIIKALPEGATERTELVNAYADALKVVWAVMAGLAFVALLLSLLTKGLTLDTRMESEQALRRREN